MKEQLRSMLNALINGNAEQAQVDFHEYVTLKTRAIISEDDSEEDEDADKKKSDEDDEDKADKKSKKSKKSEEDEDEEDK